MEIYAVIKLALQLLFLNSEYLLINIKSGDIYVVIRN